MSIWRANCKNIRWLFNCSGPFDHQLAQNLALRKTAEDNHHSFPPNVINTVKRNYFVDDCLKSLPAEQKAVEHVGSLCTLLSRGGFKLARWVSNSRDVLKTIPEQERAKEIKDVDIRKDALPIQ